MPRRANRDSRPLSGIVLIDKPQGRTSNKTLQWAKRLFQAQKAGHTGTLDPMATGMLPVCFGAATRVSGLMLAASKRYRVTARFGVSTDTGDSGGAETGRRDDGPLPADEIRRAVKSMLGRTEQVPPMYSALKHEGRRLYELARAGTEVPRKARAIELHALEIEDLSWPFLTLFVHCSKGTYIRTVITDLAAKLGTIGHVSALRRLSVDPFDESQMVGVETLELAAAGGPADLDRWLLGIDSALTGYPALSLPERDVDAFRHGRPVEVDAVEPAPIVRIYDPRGEFVGIADIGPSGELKSRRVFSR